jgi:hypothetical protein
MFKCYDGAPNTELRLAMEDAELAGKQLAERGLRAAYFPSEQGWMVFRLSDYKQITGFLPTKRAAADAALAAETA